MPSGPRYENVNAAHDDAPSERRGGSRTAPTPGNAPPSIGQVVRSGGFDCVIGNPPYGAVLGEEDIAYLRRGYATATSELDTYGLFIEKATNVCKSQGRISMIIPTGWYSGVRFSSLRRFVACHMDPEDFINLPYDVFEAWVDTTVFVGAKRAKPLAWPRLVPCNVTLRTFPKRHKIQAVAEFDEEGKAVDFTNWFANGGDEFLTYADTTSSQLMAKVQNVSRPMNEFADIQRGVTPFNLTDAPDHKHSVRAFAGTVRRYSVDSGEQEVHKV